MKTNNEYYNDVRAKTKNYDDRIHELLCELIARIDSRQQISYNETLSTLNDHARNALRMIHEHDALTFDDMN